MYGSGDDYNGYDDEVDAWDNDDYDDRVNGDDVVQPRGLSVFSTCSTCSSFLQ